jgi:hypothetical protein
MPCRVSCVLVASPSLTIHWGQGAPAGVSLHLPLSLLMDKTPQIQTRRIDMQSKKSSKPAERVVYRTLADGTRKTYRYPAYKPRVSGDTLEDLADA